jgi:hypothetical protein
MFSQYKIVRLAAPIFYASEKELAAFAARGLSVTVVAAETPGELILLVEDADIVVNPTVIPRFPLAARR